MFLTINTLFNDPMVMSAVIDRVQALKLDEIYWKKHMDFEETRSRVFKTYLGTVTGVTAGSIIDRNSQKPLRERKSLGSGYGEVAYLGDRYQMDNDRLDMLQELINKFNAANTASQKAAMNDIIAYITDDMRQVMLAPHKRMDIVDGSLRSTGKASVKVADNPEGIEILDISLPFHYETPQEGDKSHFVKYLMDLVVKLQAKYGKFVSMEMSRKTFIETIIGSQDFGDYYKQTIGSKEYQITNGLMSSDTATSIFMGLGLPSIVINEDMVEQTDGTMKQVFEDNRISLFTSDKQGKMKWHTPYEITDPIPGKNYSRSEGGMYISNVRTEEGRFMEYGCEWIPDYQNPNKVVNLDLATMNPK